MRCTSSTLPPVLLPCPQSGSQAPRVAGLEDVLTSSSVTTVYLVPSGNHFVPPQSRGHFPKELGLNQEEQSSTRHPHS